MYGSATPHLQRAPPPVQSRLTTSRVRALFCRKPDPDRPLLSFKAELRSVREACKAGMRPNRMLVTSVTPAVNASTRQSTVTSAPSLPTRGRSAVFTRSNARMPITPSADPSNAPQIASKTLSVSICRISRRGSRRSAARIAISRRRPMARASSRFATFAQAISRTKLTAHRSTRELRERYLRALRESARR